MKIARNDAVSHPSTVTTPSAFAVLTLSGQGVSGAYNANLTTGGVTFNGNIGYPATIVAMSGSWSIAVISSPALSMPWFSRYPTASRSG